MNPHTKEPAPVSLTARQWLVLDNLNNHWKYFTNLDRAAANAAYCQCVKNGWIENGKITPCGIVALSSKRLYETQP